MNRRSLLFMPGNNPGMLTTADVLGADTIVFDLEDAVSLNEKDSARTLVKEALSFLHFSHSEVSVRINPFDSPYWQDDLKFIIEGKPDSIVIPKASVESVKAIEAEMNRLKGLYHIEKDIKFILIIETAMGLVDVKNIVESSSLIDGIILGAEDLSSDMGIRRSKSNKEIEYARYVIATIARAYRIDAIDTPYTDIDDFEGLARDTTFAKSLGFTGRLAINPRQVETLHEVFSPVKEDIDEALAILQEADEAKKMGLGVFSYKGKMVDLPVIKRAENTIASAKRWRLIR